MRAYVCVCVYLIRVSGRELFFGEDITHAFKKGFKLGLVVVVGDEWVEWKECNDGKDDDDNDDDDDDDDDDNDDDDDGDNDDCDNDDDEKKEEEAEDNLRDAVGGTGRSDGVVGGTGG